MKIDPQHRLDFADRGVIHLKGAVPKSKVGPAKDSIYQELERLRLREKGKWHLKPSDHAAPFKVAGEISRKIRPQPSFDGMISSELARFMSELAGHTLVASPAQVLVTPPQKMEWSVPHLGWHLDLAAPSRNEVPGVQAFVLLDDVAPCGGGTLAIAGSHRLHGLKGSGGGNAHHVLQESYADLFAADVSDRDRFLRPHLVHDVAVQVVEMCGRAGDVYVMDMRVLHAPAVNATKQARLMLTVRYLKP